MDLTNAELKLTIAKLIEIAYSRKKGVAADIVMGSDKAKLIVDMDGHATLSSKVSIMTFDGSEALEKIGASFRSLDVTFWTEGESKEIHYMASYGIRMPAKTLTTTLSVSGTFDIEELITACSGLLCQAARALKGADSTLDAQLQRVMGQ